MRGLCVVYGSALSSSPEGTYGTSDPHLHLLLFKLGVSSVLQAVRGKSELLQPGFGSLAHGYAGPKYWQHDGTTAALQTIAQSFAASSVIFVARVISENNGLE